MGRQIDIRIMNLNKWYIPKSFSLDELKHPVVLGYFDALQMREVSVDPDEIHPFAAGYKKQEAEKNKEKNTLVDYSSQEQILFLNICSDDEEENGVYFKRETVDQFWKDQTFPYTFLSMIHVGHGGRLEQALRKIKNVFEGNYLCYVSFDYCDIVLFAHNQQITEFMYRLKCLFKAEGAKDAVIFDTFSMICFQPKLIKEKYWEKDIRSEEGANADFQATINLSIRDYKKFSEWYTGLKKLNSNIERYNMFGRHDISIVNERAETAWLIQVMDMLHKEESREIFWTFETYIKIKDKEDVEMTPWEPDYLKDVYHYVKTKLDIEILGTEESKGLKEIVLQSDFRDKSRYLLPIYEVRDCICSIVKNSFAEEFIYCIYESFLHFISYMKEKIQDMTKLGINPINCETNISKEYDSYFAGLNTLVNSTMHNERQFVQATAFNAVFYSVPPKIMAFYNAYIYRIKQILQDETCKDEYTFLIHPSFSPLIFVEQISLGDNVSGDRLLTVRISEKSLYDIESVMYQLVHELAHYVGNDLRCRRVRKRTIMDTLIKYIVKECSLDEETHKIITYFVRENMQADGGKENESLREEQSDYLNYINYEGLQFLQSLEYVQERQDLLERYYQEKISREEDISDDLLEKFGVEKRLQRDFIEKSLPKFCALKSEALQDELKVFKYQEQGDAYLSYIDLIKWVYRESYADLQMILVLAMDAESYLSTFFIKQNVPGADMLTDIQSMLRISTIYRVMRECGIWKRGEGNQNSRFTKIIADIEAYNDRFEKEMKEKELVEFEKRKDSVRKLADEYDVTNGIQLKQLIPEQEDHLDQSATENQDIGFYADVANGLYEYLFEVTRESLAEYARETKKEMIAAVRKVVGKILAFEDTQKVFDCIEEELQYYKEKGCKITPNMK